MSLVAKPSARGLGCGATIALVAILVVVSMVSTQVQKSNEERAILAETGNHPVSLSGEMVIDGRWQVSELATLSTDAKWTTTQLRLEIKKLDNALASSTVIRVVLGSMVCETRRPFTVYNNESGGGQLFAGESGYQELHCSPYEPLSRLLAIDSGIVAAG